MFEYLLDVIKFLHILMASLLLDLSKLLNSCVFTPLRVPRAPDSHQHVPTKASGK